MKHTYMIDLLVKDISEFKDLSPIVTQIKNLNHHIVAEDHDGKIETGYINKNERFSLSSNYYYVAPLSDDFKEFVAVITLENPMTKQLQELFEGRIK